MKMVLALLLIAGLADGQGKTEYGALVALRVIVKVAVVGVDDGHADGQAQPHAMGFAGHERIEQFVLQFPVSTGAGVFDGSDNGVAAGGAGPQRQNAFAFVDFRHGLDSVAYQVQDDLVDLNMLGMHQGNFRIQIANHADTCLADFGLQEQEHFLDQLVDLNLGMAGFFLAYELAQLLDDTAGAACLGADGFQNVHYLVGRWGTGFQQADAGIGAGGNGGKGLIQLMSHAGCHFAHGTESGDVGQFHLILAVCLCSLLARADVPKHNHRTDDITLLIANGGAAVLHRNAIAVSSPEQVFFHIAGFAFAKCEIYRAFRPWIGAAVLPGVMQELVLVGADEIFGPPAGDFGNRLVDESRVSLQIHAIDSVGYGIEDEVVLALQHAFRFLQRLVETHDPAGHHQHEQQEGHGDQQPVPVFFDGVAEGEALRTVIGREMQIAQQIVYRLVFQWCGPAGVLAPLGCRLQGGHLQQRDGNPPGELCRRVLQLAERPFGIELRTVRERIPGIFLLAQNPEFTGSGCASLGQVLEYACAHRAHIGLAVLDCLHNGIMCAAELQAFRVLVGIDADLLQLFPGHLEAAQGSLVYGHQILSPQVFQFPDVLSVAARENDPAEHVGCAVVDEVVQDDDAGNPVTHFHVDIDAGIDQQEIHRAVSDCRFDFPEVQRNDDEVILRYHPGKIIGGWRPVAQGGFIAPVAQYADSHFRSLCSGKAGGKQADCHEKEQNGAAGSRAVSHGVRPVHKGRDR